jgi:hypothetical protein
MTETPMQQLLDAAAIDANYRAPQAIATVCLRADLTTEIEQLEADLKSVERADEENNRAPEAPALAQRILELQAEAAAATVRFVFQSMGRRRWSDLIRSHKPTEEQKRLAEESDMIVAFNTDTFPPAAMHASCIEPANLTLDWWQQIYDRWGEGQVRVLFNACQAAHFGVADVPKAPRAAALMNGSARNSG